MSKVRWHSVFCGFSKCTSVHEFWANITHKSLQKDCANTVLTIMAYLWVRIVALLRINRLIFTNKCKEIHKNVSNSQINKMRLANKKVFTNVLLFYKLYTFVNCFLCICKSPHASVDFETLLVLTCRKIHK